MKGITAIALLFCLTLGASIKAETDVKNPVLYSIDTLIKDNSLVNGEASYYFKCYNSGGVLPNNTILYSCDGNENRISTDKDGGFACKVRAGKHVFQFFLNSAYEEIYTDSIGAKSGYRTVVSIHFPSAVIRVIAEKPVVYIYSTDSADVKVNLKPAGSLVFTYPRYNNGWSVKATPSGNLIAGKATYPYLFWESDAQLDISSLKTTQGFLISNENLITFFEEKLSAMGLNAHEKADFITYWAPRMLCSERVFVHFLFNKEIDPIAELHVTPCPNQEFRVMMLWIPVNSVDSYSGIQEQVIPSFDRNGLTVVEWGGIELTDIKK